MSETMKLPALEAMLKHSRKRMLQRTKKILAKHAGETERMAEAKKIGAREDCETEDHAKS